jgi:hypothetical protein
VSESNRLIEIAQRLRQRVAAERSLIMLGSSPLADEVRARPRHRGVSHTLLCLSCKYYNPTTQAYLRCAVHPDPEGPKSDTCPDKEER